MGNSIVDVRKNFHKTHDLIFTIYHEAGHIVYGLLYIINILGVSVEENKKTKRVDGLTEYHPWLLTDLEDSKLFNDRLHAEICFHYAGLISEKIYFKLISGSNKLPAYLKEGSSTDFSNATALFEKFQLLDSGKPRLEYKKNLMKEISDELLNHWDAVMLVAHGLYKKKKYSFNDLKLLLTKKSKNKKFWKNKFKIHEQLYENIDKLDENQIKTILSL